jgi:hypothetical protein
MVSSLVALGALTSSSLLFAAGFSVKLEERTTEHFVTSVETEANVASFERTLDAAGFDDGPTDLDS